ncbi:MAG: Lrp/AsnC ligand binding domain-containing protein [Litoreibacter sp.]
MTEALDIYDQSILQAISADGRITVTELANRINLSKSPTQARLKRLENSGYINGYKAQLNPAKLGLAQVGFVEIKLQDTQEGALQAFNTSIKSIDEVEQCHLITGRFDYLLKIRASSVPNFRKILSDKIASLPNVSHTSTHLVMDAVKENTF